MEMRQRPEHRLTIADVYDELRHVLYGNGGIGVLEDLRNVRRELVDFEGRIPELVATAVAVAFEQRASAVERRAFPWARLVFSVTEKVAVVAVVAVGSWVIGVFVFGLRLSIAGAP